MEKLRITVIILVVSLLSVGPTMAQEQAAQEQAQTTSRFLGGLCIVIEDVVSALHRQCSHCGQVDELE
jgi:hypothetical protein